ncbi:hypothetical protein Hypma_014332 [Hypsizygus marmoreus]|uniref:AB hydrolase-1 domain-containing protein n=1 Tax=Hypsizygus marmoreus TaxID=39966 RepID=A0A369JAR3_HYPMA|nr:hypothetical protein Hypma_014332 [Hypsizygus marmoreus]
MRTDSRASTKLYIPHPTEPGCFIVGILEQLSPTSPTHGRKLALILHGTMGYENLRISDAGSAHWHKDYLFQKRLGQRLPLDSFRFDFRGNHETGGVWRQGALENDLEDLFAVVEHLKIVYGYVIDLVVGHSRGSLVAMRWICTSEDGKKISGFVNASGRYRMRVKSPAAKAWQASFDEQGYYNWTVSVARKEVTVKIFPEDLEQFTKWDSSIVWDRFPPSVDVLTIHGLSDKTVPPYDALIYARALSNRVPGTHTLNLVENADHNFTGRQDQVVDAILAWWEARERGEGQHGIWVDEIKGKL